jgi:hypothetical protein
LLKVLKISLRSDFPVRAYYKFAFIDKNMHYQPVTESYLPNNLQYRGEGGQLQAAIEIVEKSEVEGMGGLADRLEFPSPPETAHLPPV